MATPDAPAKPRRRWLRWVVRPLVGALVLAGLGYGVYRWRASLPPEYPPRAWKKEIARWEKLAQQNPADERAWQRLAQLYTATGRGEEAAQYQQKLLEKHPNDPGGWDRLGRAYEARNDLAGAVRCYERVLALVANRPVGERLAARYELTLLYLEMGDREKALAQAKLAAKEAPQLRDYRLSWGYDEELGICHWALGHRAEAEAALKRAAGTGSNQAQDYLAKLQGGDGIPDEYLHPVTTRFQTIRETQRQEGQAQLPSNPPPCPWEGGATLSP